MKKLAIPLIITAVLVLGACTDRQAQNSPETVQRNLIKVGVEPVEAQFVEQDSFNIADWLHAGEKSRILVRFSGFDGTAPVPADAMEKIADLAGKGSYDELVKAADTRNAGRLFDSSNTVYVAHKLGIVKELYWIVPTFGSVTQRDLDDFKKYLTEIYPACADEVSRISLDGNVAKGSVNGIPIRMLGLEDLKEPGEPVIVDIDMSFMQQMYQNEKETPSLKFIAGMFQFLSDAGLTAGTVSIAASGEDGRAPYRLRSFGKYLAAIMKDPGMVGSKPPEHWVERAEAWVVEQKDAEIAIPIYKRMIAKHPDDAASMYDLADLYFGLGELDACASMLAEAAKVDPGYAGAFEIYSDKLKKAGQAGMAASFLSKRPGGSS